ncbi:hypothetical protein BH18PSE1_BH18PSE1_08070 [soil metagenome]
MATLKSRVERLENKAGRRRHVVKRYEGETNDEALAHAGVVPDAEDLVIFLRRFYKRPEEVAGAGGTESNPAEAGRAPANAEQQDSRDGNFGGNHKTACARFLGI